MKLQFNIEQDEPELVMSDLNNKDIHLLLSIYDNEPMERLHKLFLMLNRRWLGYSSEEFEYEGYYTAIAFTPSDNHEFSLMTVDQGDSSELVKNYRVNNRDIKQAYKEAFLNLVNSFTQEEINKVESDISLGISFFKGFDNNED